MPAGDPLAAILLPFVLAAFSLLPAASLAAAGVVASAASWAAGNGQFYFFAPLFFENSVFKELKTCIIFFNYFKINVFVIVQSYD